MKNSLCRFLFVSFAVTVAGKGAIAQSIVPALDGTGTMVTPEGDRFEIRGGQLSGDGANLFHSFEEFGLSQGEIADFLANPNLDNIFGRVTGGNVSIIDGLLQVSGGNANLYLLNPAGILFGENASLNVPADFTATTATGIGFENGTWLDVLGANSWGSLLGSPHTFEFAALDLGAIVNQGNLAVAEGQHLRLFGGTIANRGSLQAPGGNISIAAVPGGNSIRLSADGNVLSLEIANLLPDSPFASPVLPTSGLDLPDLLTGGNVGNATRVVVRADGTVQLTGSRDRLSNTGQLSASSNLLGGNIDLMGSVVENRGQIEANGIQGGSLHVDAGNFLQAGEMSAIGRTGDGGEIRVNYSGTAIQTARGTTTANGRTGGAIAWLGSADTVLTTSGTFEATGEETGGAIALFGEEVRLLGTRLDASGDRGGGEILVGGDFQGRTGQIPGATNARNTFVNPTSHLNADARSFGDGGRVVVWSDEDTQFFGNITARGGESRGNGGTIEVSGKNELTFGGFADAGAIEGLAGQLLLDPKNIIIDATSSGGLFQILDPNPAAGNDFGERIVVLGNGNLVATSPGDDFAATDAGAVYLFDPETGELLGQINGENPDDRFGSDRVTALTNNNNYVFGNPNADINGIQDAGTMILADGETGEEISRISGVNPDDFFGNSRIAALPNGNYVFGNPNAARNGLDDLGAVILADGTTGEEIGRIWGETPTDRFGLDTIQPLPNGNYVFANPFADIDGIPDAGTIILANGRTGGEIGRISGSSPGDRFGENDIQALPNGNFVFGSPDLNLNGMSNVGVVILGNGTTGAEIDRITGRNTDDRFGDGEIAVLPNSNYVFGTPLADLNGLEDAGVVTIVDGDTGAIVNRIEGQRTGDRLGGGDLRDLDNGNVVVANPFVDINGIEDAGTAILIDGTTGREINRISGTNPGDRFGNENSIPGPEIVALRNGNFAFTSQDADINGVEDAGTVIFADGETGEEISRISGTNPGDRVGSGAIVILDNGHLVVGNPDADVNGIQDAGMAIVLDGETGTELLRFVGTTRNERLGFHRIRALENGSFALPSADLRQIHIGNAEPSSLTYDRLPDGDITISPEFVTRVTDTGTAVTLQANNDIIQRANSAIVTQNPNGNGGSLTLQAGRSIELNADITTDNGDLTLIANDASNEVVDTAREPGNATIAIADDVTLDAGTGDITLRVDTGSGTNRNSGDLTLDATFFARNLAIEHHGLNGGNLTIGSDTFNASQSLQATATGNITLNTAFTLPGDTQLTAESGNILFRHTVDASTPGRQSLTLTADTGNITFSGAIGQTAELNTLTANSGGITRFDRTVNSHRLITDAPGTTELNGNITANIEQTYNDPVRILSNITLNSRPSNGPISFNRTLDSRPARPQNLTIRGSRIVFNDAVGSQTPLNTLSIESLGTTIVTDDITTRGNQTYEAATLQISDATLDSSLGNGNILLNGSISSSGNGSGNLTIDAGSGMVGGNGIFGTVENPIGDFTVLDAGTLELPGDIVTSGNLNFNARDSINIGNAIVPGGITVSAMENVTVGNLSTASVSGIGGNISLSSDTGAIVTGTLDSSGLSGGNINLDNDNATNDNDIEVSSIDARGNNSPGGDVTIDTNNFFRATGSLTDNNGINVSISTAGTRGDGRIRIEHGGGEETPPIAPFVVGDASLNGTQGVITTGEFNLSEGSYPGNITQGNINLETDGVDVRPTLEDPIEPPINPDPPSIDDNPIESQPDPSSIPETPIDQQPDSPPILEIDPNLIPSNDTDGFPGADLLPDDRESILEIEQREEDAILRDLQGEESTSIPILEALPSEDRPRQEIASLLTQDRFDPINDLSPSILPSDPRQIIANRLAKGTPDAIEDAVARIDQLFEEYFEERIGENLDDDSSQLWVEDMRSMLQTIEAETGNKSAIIYAVSLPPSQLPDSLDRDREKLALVLVRANGSPISQTVILDREDTSLRETISGFLGFIQASHNSSYRPLSQQLYRWLVQPLERDLEALDVDTIVFSIDPTLSDGETIPLAALHDGEQFLIEQYSLSLIPSLSLTETRYQSLKEKDSRILAMGISEFPSQENLPAVALEIEAIVGGPDLASKKDPLTQRSPLWLGEALLNEKFTLENLIEQRRQQFFSIVHLATHANFDPTRPDRSYIQFWDGERLSPDELRQAQWYAPPVVELLTLSACETARGGNGSMEMGFAGFAVQAGVKSVLASLWDIDDTGTLPLMLQFYRALGDAPIKAEALRQAQLALLRGEVRFENHRLIGNGLEIQLPRELSGRGDLNLSHPYYWASFTLVGSSW